MSHRKPFQAARPKSLIEGRVAHAMVVPFVSPTPSSMQSEPLRQRPFDHRRDPLVSLTHWNIGFARTISLDIPHHHVDLCCETRRVDGCAREQDEGKP